MEWTVPDDHDLVGDIFAVLGEPTDGDVATVFICWHRAAEEVTEFWAQKHLASRTGGISQAGDPTFLFDLAVGLQATLHERSQSGDMIFACASVGESG